MSEQLANEKRLIGDATTKALLKEMWTIPGNRKRAIISVMLMIWQQMTGVNAIVRPLPSPPQHQPQPPCLNRVTNTPSHRTTTPRKSSPALA